MRTLHVSSLFWFQRLSGLIILSLLCSCTNFAVTDCTEDGESVLGKDVGRIRSSRVRMIFEDSHAAAARFVPYAAMSALAYEESHTCPGAEPLKPVDGASTKELDALKSLHAVLEGTSFGGPWTPAAEIAVPGYCQDDIGFSYHVWKRQGLGTLDVVMVFRGTDNNNTKDWVYGNLYWFTHWFTDRNQYEEAVQQTKRVIAYFRTGKGQPAGGIKVRFFTAGHSLGGGLAQHVLYALPDDIIQAYAFDPSPVTAHADTPSKDTYAKACSCVAVMPEARIYRFYESHEILTHLRFIHKLFFAPDRHIQEVRFGYPESRNAVKRHSMPALAVNMVNDAQANPGQPYTVPWYASRGSRDGKSCTAFFEEEQEASCRKVADSNGDACPQ
ncbi:hypothetical protein [Caballeronia sp. J97]|uniref:hypothetical protein n=1 Tax=Caballeronia sp. J97 TaxID=2805429 RepID=UPI002AB13D21|nr:hypothetical protein [Caballeronia sp. J97]